MSFLALLRVNFSNVIPVFSSARTTLIHRPLMSLSTRHSHLKYAREASFGIDTRDAAAAGLACRVSG